MGGEGTIMSPGSVVMPPTSEEKKERKVSRPLACTLFRRRYTIWRGEKGQERRGKFQRCCR